MVSVMEVPVLAPDEPMLAAAALVPQAWVLSAAADDAILHFKSTRLTVPFEIIKPLVKVKVISLSVPDEGSEGLTTSEPALRTAVPSNS